VKDAIDGRRGRAISNSPSKHNITCPFNRAQLRHTFCFRFKLKPTVTRF